MDGDGDLTVFSTITFLSHLILYSFFGLGAPRLTASRYVTV